jgi:hypothetical protein
MSHGSTYSRVVAKNVFACLTNHITPESMSLITEVCLNTCSIKWFDYKDICRMLNFKTSNILGNQFKLPTNVCSVHKYSLFFDFLYSVTIHKIFLRATNLEKDAIHHEIMKE